MSAGRDFLLFIGFLIILGVVWFVTGGPQRTISHAGWFLSPGQLLQTGGIVPTVEGASTTGNLSQQNQQDTYQPPQAQQTIFTWQDYFNNYRPGFGEASLPPQSPYAAYISLNPANAQSPDPHTEHIVIQTSYSLRNSITVTGWSLEDPGTGLRVPIGPAAPIPFLGQVNSEMPVTVGPQSTVVVTTGRSPNGTSFRLNQCTGYLGQFQQFTPTLPQECPYPQDEFIRFGQSLAGNTQCQQFVGSLNTCTLVTSVPSQLGDSCQSFVQNTLSYAGCVNDHRNDSNFYRNEWRIYLNRDQEIWNNTHDSIWLLDENGKLVGVASY